MDPVDHKNHEKGHGERSLRTGIRFPKLGDAGWSNKDVLNKKKRKLEQWHPLSTFGLLLDIE